MIILKFLRFIRGYSDISVSGRFPERFLNLAAKNGLGLWNIKGENEHISASVCISEIRLVSELAKKSDNTLTIISEHGLPCLGRKYKKRIGLLLGLIAGSLFCVIMSGFIWNIDIHCPDELSEYEIRGELRELGLYEGVRYNYDSISRIERNMLIKDGRISWLSINIAGTNAVVEISPKTEIDSEAKKDNEKIVSNIIALADGRITGLSVRNGQAVVRCGEAVRKGELLVSGINTLSDGSNELCDSDGEILAETTHSVSFFLPKKSAVNTQGEMISEKTSVSIFGLEIPCSLSTTPDDEAFIIRKKEKLYLSCSPLPIYFTKESFFKKEKSGIAADADIAGKILDNRAALYRFFLEGQKFTTIRSESSTFSESEDGYTLTVLFCTTENIGQKSFVEVRSE